MSFHAYSRSLSFASRLAYLERTLRTFQQELEALRAEGSDRRCSACHKGKSAREFSSFVAPNGKLRKYSACKACRASQARAARAAKRAAC